jgi:uncharacterized membrane protein
MTQPVKPADIYRLAETGVLPEKDVPRALVACGLTPDAADWRRFFDRLFLVLGTTLLLAGVIFFFAWNWDDMGRLAKLGLVQVGILAAVLFSWQKGLDGLLGKISLTAAAVLVGALLAVYGQIYQTGADSWGLFFTWTLLIAGWAVLARFAPLWLILVGLANVSLMLYWGQIVRAVHRPDSAILYLVAAAVNISIYIAWEELSLRGLGWLTTRQYGVVVAAWGVACGTLMAVMEIFDDHGSLGWAYLPLVGATFAYAYNRTRDLVVLALVFLGLIVSATSLIIEVLGWRDEFFFLFYGLVVVGMTAAAAALLRFIGRSWEAVR